MDADILEALDKLDDETREEVKSLLKVTREKDGGQSYAEANFKVADIFIKEKYIDVGRGFWEKIRESDDLCIYGKALYNIGVAWNLFDKKDEAISSWSQIQRKHGIEYFVNARFNLGAIYIQIGDLAQSIKYWEEIKKSDDIETYKTLRLYIATAYSDIGFFEKSISILKDINAENDINIYLKSRNVMGSAYYRKGFIDSSIESYLKVKNFYESNNLSRDSEHWDYAMFKLGIIFFEEKRDIEQALKFWNDLKFKGKDSLYFEARFNMVRIYLEQDEERLALEIINSISKKENVSTYIKMQMYLAEFYSKRGCENISLKIWKNIEDVLKENNDEWRNYDYYLVSKIKLGMFYLEKNDLESASKSWDFFGKKYYFGEVGFEKEISNDLHVLCKKIESKEIFKNLKLCFMTIRGIVDELEICLDYLHFQKKSSERKFAHYTNTSVAKVLLQHNYKDNSCEEGSKFRLNTISNVNDPSEGLVLYEYLSLFNNLSLSKVFEKKNQVFIGCFTFNHDSLNQFRLYGKENNKEASGVSLVFKHSYFQTEYFEKINSVDMRSWERAKGFSGEENITSALNEKIDSIFPKQRLIRCVYLEPNSGYIRIAQRDKITFFHEFEDKSEAEREWKKYECYIKLKNDKVQFLIDRLKFFCQEINNKRCFIKGIKIEKDLDALLEKIFLPIKYLIKHSAFQEEQECRMMYITKIDNPRVKMVYGEALYIEYETDIKDNLDKIYIAPAATQYQPYLAKLLCDTDVKIELSNNPFRLPTSH